MSTNTRSHGCPEIKPRKPRSPASVVVDEPAKALKVEESVSQLPASTDESVRACEPTSAEESVRSSGEELARKLAPFNKFDHLSTEEIEAILRSDDMAKNAKPPAQAGWAWRTMTTYGPHMAKLVLTIGLPLALRNAQMSMSHSGPFLQI